ncbi:PilN domain-containing protein [Methylobacillus gramineus]|uniref:PilN domain-containing protein n=1 Tax=Methylobacillus gramineus TaxID=755169 RepID=UPI001CFF7F09|nr:PilN domain-containing protein [Methylobacillus gramineus]MCB5186030.1 PilN domain-containing protein [Methylobacillus gramineus]
MKIQLDYADTHPLWRISSWLFGVSLLLALVLGWKSLEMREQREALLQELTAQQAAAQPVEVQKIKPEALSAEQKMQIKQANMVLEQLGRPWPAMLGRLEQAMSIDVAILSIRPDAGKGRLRISGEAKDIPALLAYIKRLELIPEMTDVVLEEHELVEQPQSAGISRSVQFGISARWSQVS